MTSVCLVGGGAAGIVAGTAVRAGADAIGPITFESPTYSPGSVNGQDGWASTGSYDQAIVNYPGHPATFGSQSLRISDAVTSGSFGDQTFSKPVMNAAGEPGADTGGFLAGTLQTHFQASFDFASATGLPQPGLHMSVSPDRGDGARMSYVRIEDNGSNGWNLFFDDTSDNAPLATPGALNNGCGPEDGDSPLDSPFRETAPIAVPGYGPHTLTFLMNLLPGGHGNDVVDVLLDGNTIATGTSWENYYRYCAESGGGDSGLLADETRIVRDVEFRESGTATAADAGKGFLIDNFSAATQQLCTTDCYVNAVTGHNSDTGTSPATAFKTIQFGVNTVSPGGTVHVAAGTYDEEVTVGKSISLLGAQAGVDARAPRGAESIMTEGTGETPLILNADDVTVDGFTVEGQTQVNHFGAGVWMEPNTHGTHFVNNIVRNNVVGVFLTNDNGADPTLLQHNLFKDNTNPGSSSGNDIYADEFTAGGPVLGATINANKFTNTGFVEDAWAVDLSNVGLPKFSNIAVSNNSIDNHGRGVAFYATTNSSVTANTFTPGPINHYAVLLCGDDPSCYAPPYTPPGISNTNISITLNSFGCGSCIGQGVEVLDANGTASGILINRNDLHGLSPGISNTSPSSANGTCNWWGSASGPTALQTAGAVTSAPWLTAASPLATAPCTGGLPPPPPPPPTGWVCAGPPGPLSAPLTPTAAAEAFPGAAVSWAPPLHGCPSGYVVTPYLNGVGQTPTVTFGPGTTTLIKGLIAGATYTFTIAARDRDTVGPASVMTPLPVTIGAPGTVFGLSVSRAGRGALSVSFRAPAANGAPILKYTATCSSTNRGVTKSKVGRSAPLKVTGLTAGKTYTCKVKAANSRGAGRASNASRAVKA